MSPTPDKGPRQSVLREGGLGQFGVSKNWQTKISSHRFHCETNDFQRGADMEGMKYNTVYSHFLIIQCH